MKRLRPPWGAGTAGDGRPRSYHKHRCAVCGAVWRHSRHNAGNLQAHLCPACGVKERWPYRGPLQPLKKHDQRHRDRKRLARRPGHSPRTNASV